MSDNRLPGESNARNCDAAEDNQAASGTSATVPPSAAGAVQSNGGADELQRLLINQMASTGNTVPSNFGLPQSNLPQMNQLLQLQLLQSSIANANAAQERSNAADMATLSQLAGLQQGAQSPQQLQQLQQALSALQPSAGSNDAPVSGSAGEARLSSSERAPQHLPLSHPLSILQNNPLLPVNNLLLNQQAQLILLNQQVQQLMAQQSMYPHGLLLPPGAPLPQTHNPNLVAQLSRSDASSSDTGGNALPPFGAIAPLTGVGQLPSASLMPGAGSAGAVSVTASAATAQQGHLAHMNQDAADDEGSDQPLTYVGPAGTVFKAKKRRAYSHKSFPEKLYQMLLDVEATGEDDIISFTVSGHGFEIHQPDEFEKKVLPKFFRHGKLSSFRRQTSMYGFSRVSHGPEQGAYFHELFVRGRPELCKLMKRVNEVEVVAPPNPDGEEEDSKPKKGRKRRKEG